MFLLGNHLTRQFGRGKKLVSCSYVFPVALHPIPFRSLFPLPLPLHCLPSRQWLCFCPLPSPQLPYSLSAFSLPLFPATKPLAEQYLQQAVTPAVPSAFPALLCFSFFFVFHKLSLISLLLATSRLLSMCPSMFTLLILLAVGLIPVLWPFH